MPSIPALPPPAPSFAARLNSELERPQTTPPTMGASNGDHYVVHQVDNGYRRDYDRDDDDEDDDDLDRFPPPPLPLVLRPPPLRKKKSFSRVSNWLFPRDQKQQDQEQGQAGHHSRDISLDSVTNLPRPVKGSQGFYQCVAPGGQGRDSFDSMATMSTWDSDDCPRTVPTASPVDMSGPVKVQDLPPLERVGTFGTS